MTCSIGISVKGKVLSTNVDKHDDDNAFECMQVCCKEGLSA